MTVLGLFAALCSVLFLPHFSYFSLEFPFCLDIVSALFCWFLFTPVSVQVQQRIFRNATNDNLKHPREAGSAYRSVERTLLMFCAVFPRSLDTVNTPTVIYRHSRTTGCLWKGSFYFCL